MSGFNPDKLQDVFDLIVENKLSQFFTCMPCKVKSYDKDTQKVEIEPLVKRKRAFINEEQEYPPISEVPVGFFNGNDGKCYSSYPIKVNDLGIVLFFSLDVDDYLSGNGDVASNSNSYANNQLKDALFMPIIRPWNKALTGLASDNYRIQNDESSLEISPTGEFSLTGTNYEMLSELSNLMTHLLASHQTIIDALTKVQAGLASAGLALTTTPGVLVSTAAATATVATELAALLPTLTSNRADIETDKDHFDELKV